MSTYKPDSDFDFEKAKSLLLKVNALAKDGHGGEKKAAEKKLILLLKKYSMRMEDILQQEKEKRTFRVVNREDALRVLSQVIWDVAPDARITQHNRKKECYCFMTANEYMEAMEKFEHYWKAWCEEKEHTLIAFVVKNKLGVSGKDRVAPDNKTIEGVRRKMVGVRKVDYVKKMKLINHE